MSLIADWLTKNSVYFIAEIGQNHQGSLKTAMKMVDSLKDTGVAAIKTAKRDIDTCLTEVQKRTPYNGPNSFGRTYYEHRKALELSKSDFRRLKDYIEDAGFHFISSFTDRPSLDFLLSIDVKILKIASQRMADEKLLEQAATCKLPTLISTGMSSLSEVDLAVERFSSSETYLLQCTSTYPCPEEELNLNVLSSYRKRYGTKIAGIGFSGHHVGVAPDIAAYLLGATIIERHYTLGRHMKGTDHAASLELKGVQTILKYIDQVRLSLGSFDKRVLDSELIAKTKLRADLLDSSKDTMKT